MEREYFITNGLNDATGISILDQEIDLYLSNRGTGERKYFLLNYDEPLSLTEILNCYSDKKAIELLENRLSLIREVFDKYKSEVGLYGPYVSLLNNRLTLYSQEIEALEEDDDFALSLDILDDIDDEPVEASTVEIAHDQLSVAEIEPAIVIEQPHDLANISDTQLLAAVRDIHEKVDSYHYDEADREQFLNINFELNRRHKDRHEPFRRAKGKTFDPVACNRDKSGVLSRFMRDWQIVDLNYGFFHLRGLQTYESFHGIFGGESFDLTLAYRIADKKMSIGPGKKGKKVVPIEETKIGPNALNLPEWFQDKAAVLRSDAARQRQNECLDKEKRYHREMSDVVAALKAKDDRQLTKVAEGLGVVWLAIKLTGDSSTEMIALKYAELCQCDKPKDDFIKNKKKLLKKHGYR